MTLPQLTAELAEELKGLPGLSNGARGVRVAAAYDRLRDYASTHDLKRGWAGRTLVALVREADAS